MINDSNLQPCKSDISTIIFSVLDHYDSPYRTLLRKVNNIDKEYFDHIDLNTEVLNPELTLELKEKIIDDVKALADNILTSELAQKLATEISLRIQEKNSTTYDEKSLKKAIFTLNQDIIDLHDAYIAYSSEFGPFDDNSLQKQFKEAQKITWLEDIMNTNKEDIKEFHNSLMNSTFWECKKLIVNRYLDFIRSMLDNI